LAQNQHYLHATAAVAEQARFCIFKEHAIEFNKLSPQEQRAFHVRARWLNADKAVLIRDGVAALRAAIDEAELESIEYCRTMSPWNLEHCRFTKSQKDAFETLCRSPQFSNARVEQWRAQAAVAPPVPEFMYRLELSTYHVPTPVQERGPPWVPEVCRQRDYFASCVLVVAPLDPDELECCAAFMWAYQSPCCLSLAWLERSPFPVLTLGFAGGHRLEERGDYLCQHDFELCGSFIYSNNEALTTYVCLEYIYIYIYTYIDIYLYLYIYI
jgi:hypothetical protein